MKRNVLKPNDSYMVVIPAEIVKDMNISVGDQLDFNQVGDHIEARIVKKVIV